MALAEDPTFYLGTLISGGAIVSLLFFFAISIRGRRHLLERTVSPLILFLGPYLGFLGLSFARPLFDIQYVPSVQPSVYYVWTPSLLVLGVYLLGGLAFLAGYVLFPAASRRYGDLWFLTVQTLFAGIKSFVGGRKIQFFLIAFLSMWLIGLGANIVILVQVRGIPLFDIEKRSLMDPKLTFLTQLEPLIVVLAPFASTIHSTLPKRFQSVLKPSVYGLFVLGSLSALTLLGTRNLPAKLGLGLFLFWVLRPSRQPGVFKKRILLVALTGIALFVSIGLAGALQKVELYNVSIQRLPEAVFGTPMADSIGNLYSFEILFNYAGLFGRFHGNLLRTTLLSYIPGREELYANYIVGQIIGFSPEQLNSISSTFNGPPLLDFGIVGVLANSFLFGTVLSYGWAATKRSPRNLGIVALFLGTTILGIHLGTYNIWSFLMLTVLVCCVEYNKVP